MKKVILFLTVVFALWAAGCGKDAAVSYELEPAADKTAEGTPDTEGEAAGESGAVPGSHQIAVVTHRDPTRGQGAGEVLHAHAVPVKVPLHPRMDSQFRDRILVIDRQKGAKFLRIIDAQPGLD